MVTDGTNKIAIKQDNGPIKEQIEAEQPRFYKIVMLGDAGVGKTCIVNRFVKSNFADTMATKEPNSFTKVI